MGRRKGDPKYTNEVIIIEENKRWKCKHCNREFRGGFTRIKAHLEKTPGNGISICSVYCGNGGTQNIFASSSMAPQGGALNPLQVAEGDHQMIDTFCNYQINVESTSLLEATQWPDGMNFGSSINYENNAQSIISLEGGECGVSGSNNDFKRELNELVCDLTREEEDIKGQLQWLESRGKKRKSQVDLWLDEVQNLKTIADHHMQQFGSMDIRDLIQIMRRYKEWKPLVVSNEFVGEDFEENVRKMWKLLGDDKVFIIGIHGMGGVGKTFLATYMENEIKRKKSFKHVFWVTVSHDFTILKLQHHIAETMGVKLYGDDERSRATILASELEKIEKSVLILDDVWKYIDLEKVGISLRMNGIKLIITSRLKHVCQQMDCLQDHMITVTPLDAIDKEHICWELFLLKLGHHGIPATLPPEVEEIARSVVKKCDGLPLAISVMARSMKGKGDIRWWKHALNKVENFGMGEEVKTVLKRSYDNLIDKDLQKWFLYCALLPIQFDKGDWLIKFVESGMLNGKRSLEEMIDEGFVILDKLINHSLLLWDGWCLRMHDLVRNMACDKMKDKYMVKINKKLKKIPDMISCTFIQTAIRKEYVADFYMLPLRTEVFRHLVHFKISECHKIETLLTLELVPSLENLEIIDVQRCNSMEEIFAASNRGGGGSITLPKLTTLNLSNLPRLHTVYEGVLVCASRYVLKSYYCPILERLPQIVELY